MVNQILNKLDTFILQKNSYPEAIVCASHDWCWAEMEKLKFGKDTTKKIF